MLRNFIAMIKQFDLLGCYLPLFSQEFFFHLFPLISALNWLFLGDTNRMIAEVFNIYFLEYIPIGFFFILIHSVLDC